MPIVGIPVVEDTRGVTSLRGIPGEGSGVSGGIVYAAGSHPGGIIVGAVGDDPERHALETVFLSGIVPQIQADVRHEKAGIARGFLAAVRIRSGDGCITGFGA